MCGKDLGIIQHRNLQLGATEYVDWYAKQFIEDIQGHWGGEMSLVGREDGLIGKHSGSRLSYMINRRLSIPISNLLLVTSRRLGCRLAIEQAYLDHISANFSTTSILPPVGE